MPENYSGLTSKEAEKKLQEFGPNVLPEKPPPSDLAILVSQVKNPLVYVLFAAGTVTLLLQHFADTLLIFSDVFLNSILGFFQERKADKALYALRKLVHPKAKVVRDGEIRTIDVEEVVPDDTCVITQGDKIPADGEVIFANRLFVNEAILTGESVSLAKKENDKLFMGTIVTSGQGKALIKTTGANTEIGKIALSI